MIEIRIASIALESNLSLTLILICVDDILFFFVNILLNLGFSWQKERWAQRGIIGAADYEATVATMVSILLYTLCLIHTYD